MQDMLNKMLQPMDSRSLMGIFSRGKNVYKGGSNTPKSSFDLVQAIKDRYKQNAK